MNTPTPTPTPRTDAAWASSFEPCEYRAAHTARTMRDECERLEIELTALTAERDQLRAQLHALQLVCGTTDADKFLTWVDRANARAERAEAELASERGRLDWLEKARPIEWALGSEEYGEYRILTDLGEKHPEEAEEFATLRADIDAAMKEGAK